MDQLLEYANDYREIAQQCLACAAAAWHVEAKTRWLELAERWRRLAEEVKGGTPPKLSWQSSREI